jgi:hypothetical protein
VSKPTISVPWALLVNKWCRWSKFAQNSNSRWLAGARRNNGITTQWAYQDVIAVVTAAGLPRTAA